MNDLMTFKNPQGWNVRAFNVNGEPWFVGADVCKALEIDRCQMRRLDEDEKGVRLAQTPGGEQELTIINEPGLYSLILGSRKPESKAFKRWITHEVIPSIRKTGGYSLNKSYKPKATSVGEVVNLIRETRKKHGTARFVSA